MGRTLTHISAFFHFHFLILPQSNTTLSPSLSEAWSFKSTFSLSLFFLLTLFITGVLRNLTGEGQLGSHEAVGAFTLSLYFLTTVCVLKTGFQGLCIYVSLSGSPSVRQSRLTCKPAKKKKHICLNSPLLVVP